MGDRQKFTRLRAAQRVWAVSSIHGEIDSLNRLHRAMIPNLRPGDRLVYLGNLIGRRAEATATLDSLLRFRSLFLARADAFACDVVHLRGSQEEMWQKLLQLQFATDPRAVLQWMLDQGLAASLESYGFSPTEGLREAAAGPRQLTRWTGALRERIQAHPGHWQLLGSLRRAAYTDQNGAGAGNAGNEGWGLLFVNAGLDPSRPLEAQKDSFWWGSAGFAAFDQPYAGYRRVVRGFCPQGSGSGQHPGLELGDFTATVDAGCGFGGPLLAACFALDGSVVGEIEA